MLAKRIIPCLDIKDGQTVKGTNFVNLRQAGDPVELGKAYSAQGADELVYLDITASHEGRKTFTELVKRIASEIDIPFTVGGGINELADVDRLLNAGADKVSVNSAAIRSPQLIDEIAKHFGSQVCVVAIDARQTPQGWKCYLNGGRVETERQLFEWAHEANDRGAGEILFTSMDHDGVKQDTPTKPWQNFLICSQYLSSHQEEPEKWNTSATLSQKEKPMRHWLQAFFTSEKFQYPN